MTLENAALAARDIAVERMENFIARCSDDQLGDLYRHFLMDEISNLSDIVCPVIESEYASRHGGDALEDWGLSILAELE